MKPVPLATLDIDEAEAVSHLVVADLHTARASVYWMDLAMSATVGWGAFGLAVEWPFLSARMVAAAVISALALYRGLCFTHEIAHLRRDAVKGFEWAWNLVFGVALLLPSFMYVGVHQHHHSLSTYGTGDDPEYLPFARSRRMIWIFSLQSAFLIPWLLMIRFLLLAPIALLWPRVHRLLEARASSFCMNPAYRRSVPARVATVMRRWEAAILCAWAGGLALLGVGALPVRTVFVWYVVLVIVSFLNTMRVLGAHEYESDGSPRSREAQLLDSIDTPGGPWTELWAPVGLRYHALHHYFPGIPYHNLGRAYRRVSERLGRGATYFESTSPSLRASLTELYRKAGGNRLSASQ